MAVQDIYRRLFQRIEHRIIAVTFLSTLVPFVVLGYLVMREAEGQALERAAFELASSTETFGGTVQSRLEYVDREMRRYLALLQARPELVGDDWQSGGDDWWIEDREPAHGARSELVNNDGMLQMAVPLTEHYLWFDLPPSQLFLDLGDAVYGVKRCIMIDGAVADCAGSGMTDRDQLTATWRLPLADTFDGSVHIEVHAYFDKALALRSISMIGRWLPAVTVIVYLSAFVFALFFVRRTLAPLTMLQRATLRVQDGDYDHRLTIRSGDEFESLGDGFNRMTERLRTSFNALRSLAHIDRAILSATHPDDVIAQVLCHCAEAGIAAAVIMRVESDQAYTRYVWCTEGLVRERLTLEERENPHHHPRAFLSRLHQYGATAFNRLIPLRTDDGVDGFLVVVDDDEAVPLDLLQQVDELGDRLSVALTHIQRAEHLFSQAHFDPLTGLINRYAFRDRLSQAILQARRSGALGAMLFVDLDNFKNVNDTEGHSVGDRLLVDIASRIRNCLRAGDSLARLGGDEFAVITPDIQQEADLLHLCERLIAAIGEPVTIERLEHRVGASIGVALFPRDADSEEDLLRHADAAMYAAKARGGSSFAFYDNGLNEVIRERVVIESGLRRAIRDGRIEVYFQPALHTATNTIMGAEALLRWNDVELGQVEPSRFVPIAEDTGLIHEFMPIVIEQAIAAMQALDARGLPFHRIALNTSPKELLASGFGQRFIEMVRRNGGNLKRFTIEVTESVFIHDTAAVTKELRQLRSAGVTIALDDFGTGFSSLNILRTLPLDAIKIDRAFISEMTRSDKDKQLTEHIIRIAKVFDKLVIAEGVTKPQEMAMLRHFGCDYVQGYGIAEALPMAAFLDFVAARSRSAGAL